MNNINNKSEENNNIEIGISNTSNNDNELNDIDCISEKSEEEINDEEENNKNGIEFKIPNLYDRLLSDEKFIDYKNMLLEFKKKSYKRCECTNDIYDLKIPKIKKNK